MIIGVAIWALIFVKVCIENNFNHLPFNSNSQRIPFYHIILTYLTGSDVSLLNPKLSFFKLESSAILQTDKQTDIYKLHCYPRL